MEPGTQGIYTLPDSPIATLGDLKGQTVAINAPDNILFLLTASVLAEHGVSPSSVSPASRSRRCRTSSSPPPSARP
jgi:ABC-type nitrate/sulfonate/bicarbonate transport system substrate-binding protein